MRGFASAQRAYENMEPSWVQDECDCQTLYACSNCGEYSTSNTECTECDQEENGYPEPSEMQEVERTEDKEGILTDSRCRIHNHECDSRYCCD